MDNNTRFGDVMTFSTEANVSAPEIERAILGSALIDPFAVAPAIAEALTTDDFWSTDNKLVFEAICKLGTASDFLTLSNALETKLDNPETILANLTGFEGSALNYLAYIAQLKDRSMRRQVLRINSEVARSAFDEDIPITDAIIKAQLNLDAIINRQGLRRERSLSDVMGDIWTKIDQRVNDPEAAVGIPFTYRDLDLKVGGLDNDYFAIVAGRPGMGKTAFMISMALRQAKQGIPVVFYPYEMGDISIGYRILSIESGFEYQELKSVRRREGEKWRSMTSEELSVILKAQATLDKLPLYFEEDMPTVDEIKSRVSKMKLKYGVQIAYLDYLQLMKGNHRASNRVEELTYITRMLKEAARATNVPLVAGSQVKREIEGRGDQRPIMSDMRESGSIEQDADMILGLYRDEVYNPATEFKNILELLVLKNRNGATPRPLLFYDSRLMQVNDLAKERIEL